MSRSNTLHCRYNALAPLGLDWGYINRFWSVQVCAWTILSMANVVFSNLHIDHFIEVTTQLLSYLHHHLNGTL